MSTNGMTARPSAWDFSNDHNPLTPAPHSASMANSHLEDLVLGYAGQEVCAPSHELYHCLQRPASLLAHRHAAAGPTGSPVVSGSMWL
ncbi:hypothetical protein [Rhizobium laguerreae]|uniref:hypothetical protein n=1 Tax=Rhizobium laguerreae TaxID=1076926 RepID=UPI001440F08F|nr:hypothetical protein [Rhizobium laguerreae]NKN14522.1 hypothetical protein [Rhizobium laguerreae]